MAVQVRVQVDPTALETELSSRSGAPARVMAGLASWATRNARELAAQRIQSRTGAYVRGISSQLTQGPGGATLRVAAEAPHSVFIEFGTKPHPISAVGGGFLRWTGAGGQVHFAREVNHPGTQAQHIITDTLNALSGVFDEVASQETSTTF